MARAIDADALLNEAEYDSNVRLVVSVDKINNAPTLTPPKEATYPCDLCVYNPPSSLDGKPCTCCPATGRLPEGEAK